MKYNYVVELLPFIEKGIKEALSESGINAERCWLNFSKEPIHFKNIEKMNTEQKEDFVKFLVMSYGIMDSLEFGSIRYKEQGSSISPLFDFSLPFETDEQKEKYIELRHWLVGTKPRSRLLDKAFA